MNVFQDTIVITLHMTSLIHKEHLLATQCWRGESESLEFDRSVKTVEKQIDEVSLKVVNMVAGESVWQTAADTSWSSLSSKKDKHVKRKYNVKEIHLWKFKGHHG